ncbi:GntR family transcriptional regulator [Virgibacillus halodenitrificans]|uniref:GntR family transcriptional regulator n=1 Tax=Virgibacillus halodenitrificans TaxID=1482 RepID=A0AAC9J236_VIRHA|nr:GntR family transcriptional regulator [Virgibacillus halodenitrificans]APC49485.1 GntR family transcriptional regulator [Virgibacillus halodenitrificans]MBD1221159.1 GntR family transcriptional regulator [Virgibacillus halodenitrificans]MYL45169.1 UTRA domain-containing protein [Virgibacillus halodenitrificans]
MIDSNNPIPLHVQISNALVKQIKAGMYKDKIPSERELIEAYTVSRTTVRQAIAKLVNDGILKKVHGKGTFINEGKPIQEWLSNLNSLTETIKNMGMAPSSKLLAAEQIDVKDHSIDILNMDLYMIERLRYADGEPLAIEKHYYPLSVGLKLSSYDLETETIFDLLENEMGITLAEAEQIISTEDADARVAGLLGIPKGASVLTVERIIADELGNPLEFYRGYYRPDKYVFRVKSKRNGLRS